MYIALDDLTIECREKSMTAILTEFICYRYVLLECEHDSSYPSQSVQVAGQGHYRYRVVFELVTFGKVGSVK